MERDDLIKGNKLIAEFMGGKQISSGYFVPIHGVINPDTIELGNGNILKYHSSWDWLIPVIDKIYSSDDYSKYVTETSGQFESALSINTKFIETTFYNVIEFIQWYNGYNH